jgi:hypothetical protein
MHRNQFGPKSTCYKTNDDELTYYEESTFSKIYIIAVNTFYYLNYLVLSSMQVQVQSGASLGCCSSKSHVCPIHDVIRVSVELEYYYNV